MPITNSKEKFVHELADMYDAEHQFLEAMRKMRERATSVKLQTMLEEQYAADGRADRTPRARVRAGR